ncbi:sensor histidine kinase [Enterovirga rhinocerotis]|uniref:histidine kinase n=1 Tax=Enterovirga rhinocerotis TaxID=1339210 RepID=A0A4R7BUA9_9HYPH|nr:sensor histidine kinase [Enterovirga rhinocerotis]TDR88973.1 signal transduction histidine kinase [Enterovirga rhinocerotis]
MRLLAGRSIATRLVVSSLFWSSVVLVIAGVILSALYRQTTERSFDDLLLVYANDLAAELLTPEAERREIGARGDPRFEIPLSGWYWQVVRIEGSARDLRSSRSLIGNPLPNLAPAASDRKFGETRKQSRDGPEGRPLRIVERDIDLGEDGRYIVRVAGPTDEISAAVARFTTALAITFSLLGIGLGVSTLLQIRFGLRPLSELRAAVTSVRRGETDHIRGTYPGDVAPLADELNLLLGTNREILERARTQVGNLAHALKTPLSVIVNEASDGGAEAPDRIRDQVMLMRDQVDYYLKRARTAALAGTLGVMTDVKPVLDGLVRTFAKIYRDRGIELSLDCPDGVRFRGERQDLEEMAGNLLDNACKWADRKVSVSVQLSSARERGALCLVVEDDGQGMPEEARLDALKRGRRFDETKPGSGLGLSIVVDLAALYQGELALGSSEQGGLRAELRLPAEAAG